MSSTTSPKPNGRPSKITPQIVDAVMLMLARYWPPNRVKAILAEKCQLSARTSDRVLAKAREALRAAAKRDLAELKEDAYSFYVSIIRKSDASDRDKLLAQQRIDKLMGLESPTVLKHTGSVEVAAQDELLELVMKDADAVNAANTLARRMALHAGGAGESTN